MPACSSCMINPAASCDAVSLSTSYSSRINSTRWLKLSASSICSQINSPVSVRVTIPLNSRAVCPEGNQYDFSGYVSFDKFFGSFHLLKKRYVLMMVLRKGIMFGHMWAKNFHWKSSGTIHFPFRFTLIMMAKICSL